SLSGEIMAITLNEVTAETLLTRGLVLALVGFGVTVAVYGAVALIVKIDDVGLHLTQRPGDAARWLGRLLLRAMPKLLTTLSVVGTVAMLWVGGGIILHGLHEVGLHSPADLAHGIQHGVEAATGALAGVLGWVTYAGVSALVGLMLGAVIAVVLHKVLRIGVHRLFKTGGPADPSQIRLAYRRARPSPRCALRGGRFRRSTCRNPRVRGYIPPRRLLRGSARRSARSPRCNPPCRR